MADPGAVTDAQVARFRRELEQSLDAITRKLEAAVRRAKTDGDGALVKDAGNLELSRRLGEQIADLADNALGEVGDRFREAVESLLRSVGREMRNAGIGEAFSQGGEISTALQRGGALDDLIRSATRTIKADSADLRASLRAVAVQSIRTNVSPARLVESLAGEVGATVARTLSLVDTTLSGIDRASITLVGESAGVEWYELAGPVDALTRPWCRTRVGKRFTLDSLDSVPNETGPNPPSLYCGGWNCRHRLRPLVSPEDVAEVPRWRG